MKSHCAALTGSPGVCDPLTWGHCCFLSSPWLGCPALSPALGLLLLSKVTA